MAILAFHTCTAKLPDTLPKLVNDQLERKISLKSPSVHELFSIKVTNQEKEISVDTYYIVLDAERAKDIAFVEARQGEIASSKKPDGPVLPGIEEDKQLSDTEHTVYRVNLTSPLAPQQSIYLQVGFVYTHRRVRVEPAKVPQNGQQYMLWEDNAYVLSPYASTKQKTIIATPNKNIKSYSTQPEPVEINSEGTILTFGPYEVPANTLGKPIHVHYEQPKVPVTVLTHRRELEVSHWGNNLATEEHYKIRHAGAALEHEFNRVAFQNAYNSVDKAPVLYTIRVPLPASAHDVYYRDPIGNVSTSALITQSGQQGMLLRPRFPMYGGWQYRFYYGYDRPLGEVLQHQKGTNTYILQVPFIEVAHGWTYDNSELRILLPEGATNIKVHLPFKVDEIRYGLVRTYLDIVGRTTIWIRKQNVVDEHAQPIVVSSVYTMLILLFTSISTDHL
jgi:oligosaccharyltransferase complex subunit alpha (ribophorin I)